MQVLFLIFFYFFAFFVLAEVKGLFPPFKQGKFSLFLFLKCLNKSPKKYILTTEKKRRPTAKPCF